MVFFFKFCRYGKRSVSKVFRDKLRRSGVANKGVAEKLSIFPLRLKANHYGGASNLSAEHLLRKLRDLPEKVLGSVVENDLRLLLDVGE